MTLYVLFTIIKMIMYGRFGNENEQKYDYLHDYVTVIIHKYEK